MCSKEVYCIVIVCFLFNTGNDKANFPLQDTGLWGVYFISDPLKIEDMVFNIQQEFIRLCTSLTEAEVNRAKAVLTANTFLQLDTSTAVCEDIGA